MAKKETKEQEGFEEVQNVLSASEQWVEQHKTVILGVLCATIVVLCGYMFISNQQSKKAVAASEENASIEMYLQQNDFAKALAGDDAECLGAAAVADEYGNQQGDLAALYAGICEYKLGQYEEAVAHIKRFSADDVTINVAAKMLLGDCYVELEKLEDAAKAFEAAAKTGNKLVAPVALKKAGVVYLKLDDKAAANKAFEQIKNKYPQSAEAREIEKFIF